jgi:hypothetical protein
MFKLKRVTSVLLALVSFGVYATPNIVVTISNSNSIPSTAWVGNSFTAYTFYQNTGSSTVGQTQLMFYLSADQVVDQNDVLLSSESIQMLFPSGAVGTTTSLTIPTNAPVGNVYLLAVGDGLDTYDELSEEDNVAIKEIEIMSNSGQSDLLPVIHNIQNGYQVNQGATFTLPGLVFNFGASPSGSSLSRIYLSSDQIIDGSDILLNSHSVAGSNPSSSSSFSEQVTIPLSTPVGTQYILYQADANGQISESNESNNVDVRQLQILYTEQRPDYSLNYDLSTGENTCTVVVGGVEKSAPAFTSADWIDLDVDISNNASFNASNTSVLNIFVSTKSTFDGNAKIVGTNGNIPAISANSTHSSSYSFQLNPNWSFGQKYILIMVDFENDVDEFNENNNIIAIPICFVDEEEGRIKGGELSSLDMLDRMGQEPNLVLIRVSDFSGTVYLEKGELEKQEGLVNLNPGFYIYYYQDSKSGEISTKKVYIQ